MTLSHGTALRSALADAVDAYVNGGGGTATLRVRAGSTTLVDLPLGNPAFGDAAGGAIALNAVANANAVAAGTADNFQILARDGTVALSGSITAVDGGGDIEASNPVIALGQTCSVTAFTYTAPA